MTTFQTASSTTSRWARYQTRAVRSHCTRWAQAWPNTRSPALRCKHRPKMTKDREETPPLWIALRVCPISIRSRRKRTLLCTLVIAESTSTMRLCPVSSIRISARLTTEVLISLGRQRDANELPNIFSLQTSSLSLDLTQQWLVSWRRIFSLWWMEASSCSTRIIAGPSFTRSSTVATNQVFLASARKLTSWRAELASSRISESDRCSLFHPNSVAAAKILLFKMQIIYT